jgi:uncharacterized protein (TIGR03437 family)
MRPVILLALAAALASAQTAPRIAGCEVFPFDNIWNVPVDTLPVAANSATLVRTIGASTSLHPDFGTIYGIPYAVVHGDALTKSTVTFDYAGESDAGPYPIPANPPIEGGSDRHILLVDQDHCVLYELYAASRASNGAWSAGSGAIFDLKSNLLRPDTWTSADAAGLPILPGLVRYDEVAAGEIRHAIRFTAPKTRNAYVWPATHMASSLDGAAYPRMGERFRLRADFDTSSFSADVRVILHAFKKYGIILADNGSAWYVTGATDSHWDNDRLADEFRRLKGSDFEAVDTSALRDIAGSGRVRRTAWAPPVVNAASYRAGSVAPGELISVFGANLGPETGVELQLDNRGYVATTLGGTEVRFDGVAAPVIFARHDQVNAIVPYGVAGRTTTQLEVRYNGAAVYSETLEVTTATPGILARDASGTGQAAILNNDDYSMNSAAHPARRGSFVLIYAVGAGQTIPAGTDGKLGGATPPRADLARVSLRIGGLAAKVDYAGGARGLVAGVLQVNAVVPDAVTPGDAVPLQLTIDGLASQPEMTLAVK